MSLTQNDPSTITVEFTIVTKDRLMEPVDSPPTCSYNWNAYAIKCIHDRVQGAFVDAPYDGYVEWEVRFSAVRSMSTKVSMGHPDLARRRLAKFTLELRRDLADRDSAYGNLFPHDEVDEDAVTMVRRVPRIRASSAGDLATAIQECLANQDS